MSQISPASSHQNTLLRVPAITLGIGITLAIAVLLCTAGYMFAPPPYQNTLLFFAAACAAAGQLAGVFYAARILELSAQTNLETTRESSRVRDQDLMKAKCDCARQFGSRWNDATIFHVRQQCQNLLDAKGNQDEVRKIIDASDNSKTNVKHLLNFLEELAVSLECGLCDEAVAKRLFCGIVVDLWHSVDFYVREHRTRRGRPKIWVDLEKLYDRWKA